jgi:signal transduction histidine kinase
VEHGSADSRPQANDGSKHSSDDLTVRVGLHRDGFYIEDDGPGIADADRDRIFEPGYTTQDGGTGYGLEIVRTVAEAHDWEITVTDAANGGARFEITGVDTVESGS